MKKRITEIYLNFLMFWECFFKNKYSRTALYLLILSILLFWLGDWVSIIIGTFLLALSLFVFLILRFGFSSYIICKRTYDHMINYHKMVHPETYCMSIGITVAERRFMKKYPQEYGKMLADQHMLGLLRIMVTFFS